MDTTDKYIKENKENLKEVNAGFCVLHMVKRTILAFC